MHYPGMFGVTTPTLSPTGVVHLVLLGVSSALTAALAVVGWRHRTRPAARPFVGLMVVVTIWSVGYAGGLATSTRGARIGWEQLQWFGISFVPLFLLLFFAEYTGFEALQRPVSAAVLAVVPVTTLCLVWTNPLHHLIWTDATFVTTAGLTVVHQEFGAWYWVNLLYTYLLAGGGLFMLLHAMRESSAVVRPRSTLLLVGIGAPFVANLASVLGVQPIAGLDLTPYVFGVTGIAFARAVFDYELFDRPPSTLHLGRLSALRSIRDAVVVTDHGGHVVYCNPAALDVLGAPSVHGTHVGSLLETVPRPTAAPHVQRIDGRLFEVQASTVEDASDRSLGTMYLLHDVTRREERLAELERRENDLRELAEINRTLRSISRVLVSSQTVTEVTAGVTNQLQTARWYTDAAFTDERLADTVETVHGDEETTHQLSIPLRFSPAVPFVDAFRARLAPKTASEGARRQSCPRSGGLRCRTVSCRVPRASPVVPARGRGPGGAGCRP